MQRSATQQDGPDAENVLRRFLQIHRWPLLRRSDPPASLTSNVYRYSGGARRAEPDPAMRGMGLVEEKRADEQEQYGAKRQDR